MVKTLTKHGNSYALIIDKPILEMLHISPETPLEITTNGNALMVAPVRTAARKKKIRAALNKINETYGDDLKRLGE